MDMVLWMEVGWARICTHVAILQGVISPICSQADILVGSIFSLFFLLSACILCLMYIRAFVACLSLYY